MSTPQQPAASGNVPATPTTDGGLFPNQLPTSFTPARGAAQGVTPPAGANPVHQPPPALKATERPARPLGKISATPPRGGKK